MIRVDPPCPWKTSSGLRKPIAKNRWRSELAAPKCCASTRTTASSEVPLAARRQDRYCVGP